jgi:hypothetical protein
MMLTGVAGEGWVVDPDGAGPISTGSFTDPGMADDDAAGPAAGTDPAPPFPGQGFISPARDLTTPAHRVVVSVEPVPDDSAAPFALKPIVDMEVTAVVAPELQPLMNESDTLPSGVARIE